VRHGWQRLLISTLLALGLIALVLYGAFQGLSRLHFAYTPLLLAVLTGAALAWWISWVSRAMPAYLASSLDQSRVSTLRFLFQLLAYILLALAVFSVLKINVGSLLVGGAFAGLLLGLISQSVFSNLLAGILFVFAQPVRVGDRITFATWQYGVVAPAYPPKFYSSDLLIPGYTGTVEDVGFLYISLLTDDRRHVKLPAGVFMQALIINHSRSEHILLRTKYEVEKALDPQVVIPAVQAELTKNRWVLPDEAPSVLIQETTALSYILLISTPVHGHLEEPPRSDILQDVMRVVLRLKAEQQGS
jgi:small-conductance mechanosensitive channel